MQHTQIYLAPIQGITDYIFRNQILKHFVGLDIVFAPFVRFQHGLEFKKSQLTDIQPINNQTEFFIPQILSKSAEEILYFAQYINNLGYKELNWNLGCPFPMVTNKQLGSGMLPYPEIIDQTLQNVFSKIETKLSVKMRLGLINSSESIDVIKILNNYPLSELIIHPRVGKQMYKGKVDLESFSKCLEISKHKICYNGDLNNYSDFVNLKNKFKSINTFMLGRGMIANPFLAEEITKEEVIDPGIKLERFSLFHNELFENYATVLSGPGHLLTKMQQFWEYFSLSFEDSHKVFKMIKKAKSVEKYQNAIFEIFNKQDLVIKSSLYL
jgi:tRNA-dihydrouridine synthase